MKMDLRGSFVRGDTASVQSAEGRDRVVKNRFTFFAQIIVVYMIIITPLVQISLRSPDKELWLILLISSIGYILPSPGLKFRKQSIQFLLTKQIHPNSNHEQFLFDTLE